VKILGAALEADGECEVRGNGLKHQKEKRSMDHSAGLDVSANRENPFGSTHFKVRVFDWDPIRAEH
jgi:hypothetical protein